MPLSSLTVWVRRANQRRLPDRVDAYAARSGSVPSVIQTLTAPVARSHIPAYSLKRIIEQGHAPLAFLGVIHRSHKSEYSPSSSTAIVSRSASIPILGLSPAYPAPSPA